jgi:hypothetical protein
MPPNAVVSPPMPSDPRQRSARLGQGLAVAAVGLIVSVAALTPRAWAHASTGQVIMAGRQEAVSIAVNAETDSPMTAVDVTVPDGFALSSSPPAIAGSGGRWQVARQGAVLRYRGAGIEDGGMLYVEIVGTATAPGMLAFATITHAADGTAVDWTGPASSGHPAALVQVIGTGTAVASTHQRAATLPPSPRAGVVMAMAVVGAALAVAMPRRHRAGSPRRV